HLTRASDALHDWKKGVLPAAVPLALAGLLVIVEPDLGTALFLAAVGAAMMLVGGVPVKKLAFLCLAAVPVVVWQVVHRWDVVLRAALGLLYAVAARHDAEEFGGESESRSPFRRRDETGVTA